MTEKEYRALPHTSYSSLSKLAVSPQSYRASQEADRKDTPEMILGSVVDMLLTEKERFEEGVYVMTANIPSEGLQKYCITLAETGDPVQAYDASEYKISPKAVATKFDKDGKAYYDALLAAKGRMIIGAEDMMKANQIVQELTHNPFTKGYFIPDSEKIELMFQHITQWDVHFIPMEGGNMRSMKVKSMVDILHIDHANLMITPVDLKTGGEGFMKSYWRFKRYLQAAMYTDAIVEVKIPGLEEYSVNPLKFVYADTNLIYPPMVYASSTHDINIGREGQRHLVPIGTLSQKFDDTAVSVDTIGFGPGDTVKTKGYMELIAELDWHIRMDQWNYTYADFQNIGHRDIDAFSIKL